VVPGVTRARAYDIDSVRRAGRAEDLPAKKVLRQNESKGMSPGF
jgi:hypothetical protein